MEQPNWSQVDLIREAFHYQSRFSGTTMVFKIDYPLTEDAGFSYLIKDIALLSQIGIRVVIVPGAKEMIDSVLGQYQNSIYGSRKNYQRGSHALCEHGSF